MVAKISLYLWHIVSLILVIKSKFQYINDPSNEKESNRIFFWYTKFVVDILYG